MVHKKMLVIGILVNITWGAGQSYALGEELNLGVPAEEMVHASNSMAEMSSTEMSPVVGRYRGYIYPEDKEYRISSQLEFFKSQEKGDFSRLTAILRVNLGNHNSHEYISQIYNDVAYSWGSKTILLNGDDWDLMIPSLKIDGGMISGVVKSASGHREGKLLLQRVPEYSCSDEKFDSNFQSAHKTPFPVLQTLSGEYRGVCGGKNTYLQLEAGKWFEAIPGAHNPLHGYRITGRLGGDSTLCGDGLQKCVKNNFSDGYFNPYSGDLKLKGYPESLRMQVQAGQIVYNGCALKKISSMDQSFIPVTTLDWTAKIFDLKTENESELTDFPSQDDLKGHFKGFMYHSEQRKYQPVDIDVKAFAFNDRPNRPEVTHFYAYAWLYFSDSHSGDQKGYITFDFNEREFLKTTPDMIWDTGKDVRLRITSWSKNIIQGEWISTSYGVVGPFAVVRDQSLMNPPEKKNITGISFGSFQEKLWNLNLVAFEDRDPEEEALFFPIHIHGTANIKGLTELKSIESGVFDFYTGAITFALADDRVVLGWVKPEILSLFWPPRPQWGVRMSEMMFSNFNHVVPSR